MALDPKAAAAAAQAAAAAAQAAAEAAAAEATKADDARTTAPTLVDAGTRQVLEDTEAAGAGEGQLDAGRMSSVLDADARDLLGAQEPGGLLDLPALSSIGGTDRVGSVDAGSMFDLDSSFQSQQSPGLGGSDMISTVFRVNMETDKATLVRTFDPRTGLPAEGKATPGETTPNPPPPLDPPPPPPPADPPAQGSGDGTTPSGGQAPNPPPPGVETPAGDPDDPMNGGGRQLPDWSGLLPGNLGDVLTGVTGRTGSGGEDPLGPQGGGTSVNPGAEGGSTARTAGFELPMAAGYLNVTDPPRPDGEPTPVRAPDLEVLRPDADPETINPGDEMAADTMQASTADSATYGSEATGAFPEPFDDASAAVTSADDEWPGGGSGHGRDFGQGHGQGQGHAHVLDAAPGDEDMLLD